jgi:hypothetical protein
MSGLWDVAPCSLIDSEGHFRDAYCLHHQVDEAYRPDDGKSKHIWNVGRENLKSQPERIGFNI